MKNIINIILICFLLFPMAGYAQKSSELSGYVYDSGKNPIAYCTISILSPKDSSVITGGVSDEQGFYKISGLSEEDYIAKYAHLQYKTMYVNISSTGKQKDTILEPSSIDLKEVVVKGNLIKERPGGYIVDISHNPFARNKSSRETFALLPGVTANNDGLKINGNSVAKIYIDGKEATEKDLSSLRSNMIDKIEITNHAGNRYQANVSGGVIHVKLKKLANGTYQLSLGGYTNANFNEGFYSSTAYAAVRFRYKKLSFINYVDYMDYSGVTKTKYEKDFLLKNDKIITDTKEKADYGAFYDKISMAYDINEKHNIGFSFKAVLTNSTPTVQSNSETQTKGGRWFSVYDELGKTDIDNYQASLNYNWEINKEGSKFSFVADYIKNNTDNDNLSKTSFTNTDSIGYQRYYINTPTDLFKAESHLLLNISSKSKLEMGSDYYYKYINQRMLYENKIDDTWKIDDNLSDKFTYKGYGFGLYAEYTFSLKKWTFVPSLRLQMDRIETHPYKMDVNKREYWNLFPSLLVSYQTTDWLNIDAYYKRGMNDIRYGLMNPKVVYTSDNTYTKGNPDLNPGISNMLDLNTRWFKKWTLDYNLFAMKDGDRTITLVDENNPDMTYLMPVNMTKVLSHSLAVGYSTAVCKWWYINIFNSYRWRNLEYDNYKRSSSRFSYSVYNSFEFGKGYSCNLSFNGETKERLDEDFYLPVFYTNFGLNKSFFNDQLNLSFNINNFIVKKRKIETIKEDGSLRTMMWNKYYAPNLFLSISYTLSGGKKQQIRRVQTIQEVQDSKVSR